MNPYETRMKSVRANSIGSIIQTLTATPRGWCGHLWISIMARMKPVRTAYKPLSESLRLRPPPLGGVKRIPSWSAGSGSNMTPEIVEELGFDFGMVHTHLDKFTVASLLYHYRIARWSGGIGNRAGYLRRSIQKADNLEPIGGA